MAIPNARGRRIDAHTELAKMVSVARLVALGHSQKEIAEELNLSASTISRLHNKALTEGILKISVSPPRLVALEEGLHALLAPSGVSETIVVPSGPGRNIENLGSAGAAVVMDAILSIAEAKPRNESIKIVLSCGTTVLSVIQELARLLKEYCLKEKNQIRNELYIYPSTLCADFELNAVYPHTAVTIFSNLLRDIPNDLLTTRAFAPQLPKGFYEKYKQNSDERQRMLSEYGLDNLITEMKAADIFVMGAGTTTDASYQKVLQALCIEDTYSDKERIEVLYTPFDEDGVPDLFAEAQIIGVKVSECAAVKNKKHVLVIAGGREKRIPIQSIFKRPFFSTLVTDADAAEEAVIPPREPVRVRSALSQLSIK